MFGPGRHRWLLLAIAAVLFLTTDDRHPGVVADGRQMAWTAVAMTESGTIGQARARDLTIPRPGGDAVSRYGLAMSVAQLPAAVLAPIVEAGNGAGSSQPLFLLAPFGFLLIAAIAAGDAARGLGASPRGERLAIMLATLGSPLASYAAFDTSETLQAAAVTVAFCASVRRQPIVAGLAAGIAVLAKSSLLFVAPFACLPLLSTATATRRSQVTLRSATILSRAAVSFGLCLAVWLALEIARFGRPLAGYGGEAFTHPFFDGLWRLLIGVNKGLLWYFPAVIAAAFSARLPARQPLVFAGAWLPMAALLLLSASWWAWDGAFGWGPRLLVPGLPLLAVLAAIEMERWPRAAANALLIVSIALNVPPLLQHPVVSMEKELAEPWPEVSADVAVRAPFFARRQNGGTWRVVPHIVNSRNALNTPFLTLPRAFAAEPEWRVWGRGFFPTEAERGYGRVYDAGLADQVLRAQQLRDLALADRLARKLLTLAPDGFADALMMETFRLGQREQDAVSYLTGLPLERRSHPAINVVLALWERDRGSESTARAFLQSSGQAFPDSPVQRALTSPLSAWPSDFATMTEDVALQIPSAK
jgi:hypothetical protein